MGKMVLTRARLGVIDCVRGYSILTSVSSMEHVSVALWKFSAQAEINLRSGVTSGVMFGITLWIPCQYEGRYLELDRAKLPPPPPAPLPTSGALLYPDLNQQALLDHNTSIYYYIFGFYTAVSRGLAIDTPVILSTRIPQGYPEVHTL